MFTSKQELTVSMGVDPEIAAFFVDRAVPKNNAYWKGCYLYVARGTGFLFIPLFFDLQLRAGVDKNILLSEEYVQLMENILDYAGMYEAGEMDFHAHIAAIDTLVCDRSVQPAFLAKLRTYFKDNPPKPTGNIGTENAALNRGDALLFLLTVLPNNIAIINQIISYWYLLVPSFLMMDDILDLHEDQEKHEENSLSYYGYDASGIKKALVYLNENFNKLELINPILGLNCLKAIELKMDSIYFKHILKE